MIKLTKERQIIPYVWVHPDEDGVSKMVDPKQSDGGNRRGAIAGLAIAVILIAGGLWLAHALSAQSKLQDCLMSGRTNCNVIESPPR